MIISRQDILEVRRMGDYALVVQEDFWEQQLRIYSQLRGIKLYKQQIYRMVFGTVDFVKKVGEAIIRLSEILYKSFEKVLLSVKDSIKDIIEALNKLENRMLYLNRQECIRSEQYYKSQFRLVKMSYNIMYHDRRC